jgi:TPR repeat protein
MKAIRLGTFLLLFNAVVAELPAQEDSANRKTFTPPFPSRPDQPSVQQGEADRKLLSDIRAKAKRGDAQSQVQLGTVLFDGSLGMAKDEVEALKWFRKAAAQNFADAQLMVGVCYVSGRGVAMEGAEAMKWFRKAAEQNNALGQAYLGAGYATGFGLEKDELEAVKWYRKSAEQNFPMAQLWLGRCYYEGRGVAEDAVEAVRWFRKAAEQNLPEAQSYLGHCYYEGRGVAEDAVEAVMCFRKAAEQNDARAQCYLGLCFANGRGLTKDVVEAVRWWRKAAEQNLAEAQCNLGNSYRNGEGMVKNEAEAVKWWRKAAEQNFTEGQKNLGLCYALGQGVAKDYVEGYKWILLVAGQGNENAKKAMAMLENQMTREQIAEGQKLARNFKPREVPPAGSDGSGAAIAQSRPGSSGTGFFITEDGYFITSAHVAGDGGQVRLVTASGLTSAKVVKVDAANDLALLKAEGRFSALPVASSRAVKLGGTVATVGFPNIGLQGFAPKLAKGEIASLSGAQDDARYFQISVPVQPGNSGGALVDERGNVVGVVAAKLSARAALSTTGALPENVNYAVKSSFLLGFLESVPAVAAKLKEPNTRERKFEEVVKDAEQAAVLVLVY